MDNPTLSEWHVDKAGNDADEWLIYDNTGATIAVVKGQANAILAATAPKMLTALKAMLEAGGKKYGAHRRLALDAMYEATNITI